MISRARPAKSPLSLTRRQSLLLGTLLILLMGVGDQIISIEVTFTLLYVVVVALGTWFGGLRVGLWLSVLATACASFAESLMSPSHDPLPIAWNETSSLAIFALVAVLLDRVHYHLLEEQRGHRLAVEQLRHAERLNVIGTLAAGVAHEIGTPLNVISGSAEMIEHARSSATTIELAGVIRTQTARISAIIRHLLDFGRRAGQHQSEVDLNDVARNSVELVAATARKRDCTLAFLASTTRVPIMANAFEIEQVLSNLLLNALQAMPSGGEVRVRMGLTTRVDTSGGERRFATVCVEDTGVGIPADDLPRIFDPFFTTKGVGEGTGLGLSVSYGIVVDHHGSIEVDSTPGRGSRFTVMLPLR